MASFESEPTSRRRPTVSKGDRREQQILDVAESLIAEVGLGATTVEVTATTPSTHVITTNHRLHVAVEHARSLAGSPARKAVAPSRAARFASKGTHRPPEFIVLRSRTPGKGSTSCSEPSQCPFLPDGRGAEYRREWHEHIASDSTLGQGPWTPIMQLRFAGGNEKSQASFRSTSADAVRGCGEAVGRSVIGSWAVNR